MLVSLDQVNTLAKSRYKNYMITIQSVNSMMMEEIANNAGTTDDVDFLHTSAKDVDIPHREIYFHKDSITQSVVIDSITDY